MTQASDPGGVRASPPPGPTESRNRRGIGGASVTFYQTIKGGNPFCSPESVTGYIYGTQTIKITRAGSYSTTGWVKKMPNTESYYVFATSSGYSYWTAFQFTHASPLCLVD